MVVEIKDLERKYFSKNKPVEFILKNKEQIKIYPILVEEWDIFEENYDILDINKREIPSMEIIKMSYLEFILNMCRIEDKYYDKLVNILSLCLHIKNKDDIKFYFENEKPIILIKDNICISSKDFDKIKKIIMYQNIDGYDDTYISKDIREVIEKQNKIKMKGIKLLSLEDKLIFLGNKMGKPSKWFMKMPYREFQKRFNLAVEEMDYKINRTAELSGNVKFNVPIEHLIYKKDKNKYAEYFENKDNFVNKVNK